LLQFLVSSFFSAVERHAHEQTKNNICTAGERIKTTNFTGYFLWLKTELFESTYIT